MLIQASISSQDPGVAVVLPSHGLGEYFLSSALVPACSHRTGIFLQAQALALAVLMLTGLHSAGREPAALEVSTLHCPGPHTLCAPLVLLVLSRLDCKTA